MKRMRGMSLADFWNLAHLRPQTASGTNSAEVLRASKAWDASSLKIAALRLLLLPWRKVRLLLAEADERGRRVTRFEVSRLLGATACPSARLTWRRA